SSLCPRNLCDDCYASPNWKVSCKNCLRPLCVEHDLRGLRLRICGYRSLVTEKSQIDNRWAPGFRRPSDSTFRRATQNSAASMSILAPGLLPTHAAAISGIGSSGASLSSDFTQGMGDLRDEIEGRTSTSESERSSRSSSPSSLYGSSGTEAPTWTGCHSFFCPQMREAVDRRERCDIIMVECTSCKVLVCERCNDANPPCLCSHCRENYTCPNCYPTKLADGSCRRIAEEKAKAEEERNNRMLAQAGFESMFFDEMERRLYPKDRASGRSFQDDQQMIGSFLFNTYFDSEDEAGQDALYAAYGTIPPYDMDPDVEDPEAETMPDPGVGPAPPFQADEE
ncbi:hypothetical protein KEM56_006789, partial [Ascosphaera pollenicola]